MIPAHNSCLANLELLLLYKKKTYKTMYTIFRAFTVILFTI